MLGRSFDWNRLSASVLVSQSMQGLPSELLNNISEDQHPGDIRIRQNIERNNRLYWAGVIPLHDAGKRQVSSLVLLHDMRHLSAQARSDMYRFTAIFVAVGVAILILFYLVLGKTEKLLGSTRERLIRESESRGQMQVDFIEQLQDEHARLEESEERFEKISASAHDAIIAMDNDGNISLWNNVAEKILGYRQEEVLFKSLDEFLSIPAFALLKRRAIFLVCDDEKTLEMVAQRNLSPLLLQSSAMIPFGRSLCGKAAASRETLFFNHINDEHEIRYEGIEPHGHYCIPILSEDKLLGVLRALAVRY